MLITKKHMLAYFQEGHTLLEAEIAFGIKRKRDKTVIVDERYSLRFGTIFNNLRRKNKIWADENGRYHTNERTTESPVSGNG